jgi:hypothetical protein
MSNSILRKVAQYASEGYVKLLVPVLFILSLGVSAGPLTFSGTFSLDEDVVLIPFNVLADNTVTMQTTSFGDGSAGFEPVLTLFDGSGNLLFQDATGGTAPSACGARAIDPITGFCLDAYIQAFLNAGGYTLALSEWDNIPNGPTLADGFPQTGNGNFTGTEFGCGSGGFFLFNCDQRNANWAAQISGSGVPEPASWSLGVLGVLAILVRVEIRRRNRISRLT